MALAAPATAVAIIGQDPMTIGVRIHTVLMGKSL
jgi:hypothetical protein